MSNEVYGDQFIEPELDQVARDLAQLRRDHEILAGYVEEMERGIIAAFTLLQAERPPEKVFEFFRNLHGVQEPVPCDQHDAGHQAGWA
jgi:hypothetical protein